MSERRNGKTIGIFVDEVAYARYAGLGLAARKQALAAAKVALLNALGGEAGMPVVKESFTTEAVPEATAVPTPEAVPAMVETPVTEKPVAVDVATVVEETAAAETGQDADPALAGFLDAGW